MRLPTIFIPDKGLEERIEDLKKKLPEIPEQPEETTLEGWIKHYIKRREQLNEMKVMIISDRKHSYPNFLKTAEDTMRIMRENGVDIGGIMIRNNDHKDPVRSMTTTQCYEMLEETYDKEKIMVIYTSEIGLASMESDNSLEYFIKETYIIRI